MVKTHFNVILTTILLILLSLYVANAADLEIKKIDKGSVIISESTNPAVYEFIITNNGPTDDFEIYSLVSVSMGPKGKFTIPHGESNLTVYAYPNEEIRSQTGFFNFEYQLKGTNSGIFKDNLLIKIVPLAEILEIAADSITLDDKEVKVTVRNKENTNLDKVNLKLSSVFFSTTQEISLVPYQSVSFEIPITEKTENLAAGSYVFNGEIKLKDKIVKVESVVNYLQKEKISTDESAEGFFVRTNTVKKTNMGNIPAKAPIEIKKDIISRLFTVNSPEALGTREGFFVTYYWEKELAPAESFAVESKTNYTFPFIILLLIVIAGFLAKVYSQNAIAVNKNVSLVRTKGGEFALKVKLHVKARSFVTNIKIIDTLPAMAKLYEEFGKKPDKIDVNTRRLTWNIERLTGGEERVYSYIIYSKLKVVGRFELPAATAVFEKDGKIQEVWSNRTFFVSDTAVSRE